MPGSVDKEPTLQKGDDDDDVGYWYKIIILGLQ